MTVLKSFELKGNKQSFASWISNLSPCDTPFVSMIGKEGINEVQYSWQMDALDTPKGGGYEEGSDVVPEQRHPTHTLHNFTSILRKVAHVSDTVASMSTYGRNKEMGYQMGKAGKELKRDMEFMCLNSEEGNIGTDSLASQFSGFSALCAPEGYIDISTGAVTHKAVNVADLDGPWFKTSDLFDLTYNLYLAGSKANKIMFHPMHATTFSDFMSNNIETGQVYRMFDGLDTKYNAQVTKIRDPLGQKYDLIPNRFMPTNKVYIFNEADWTQMILRTPSATKLSKQGSSDRFLVEAEVGLRHRHINASGVMEMLPSTLLMEWTVKPTPLTWGVNDHKEAEITVKVRATGLPVQDTTEVTWTSSNPVVLGLTDTTGHTNGGKATNVLKPLAKGTSIVTATVGDSKASYLVTVGNPNIRLRMSNSLAERNQLVLAVVQVLKADGSPVNDGVTVNFRADPSSLVEMNSISAVTTGGSGTAEVPVKALNTLGLVQIQASVGSAVSNYARLEIVEKVEQLAFIIPHRVMAVGINDRANLEVTMTDSSGSGLPGLVVELGSTDKNVIELSKSSVTTDSQGQAQLVVTAKGIGKTTLIASYQQQQIDIEMTVGAPKIQLDVASPVHMNVPFEMTATVTRVDGSNPGVGADVLFVSEPAFSPAFVEKETNAEGKVTVSYTAMSNSDLEITAHVGEFKSNTEFVSVQ